MLFSQVPGHEAIKQKLLKTVHDNRVSHAQLFLGPEGVGKLALAIAYSQYINCERHTDTDSCGVCPSCIQYSQFVHPDLHFIFPTINDGNTKAASHNYMVQWREFIAENHCFVSLDQWYAKLDVENKQSLISAEDALDVIKALSYTSYESQYKIMIIWMVEKLHHAAAPKLLKILEEPPDKTLFILIAEDHLQVFNTILSRTQLVKVPKLADHELVEALSINLSIDRISARKAVRFAGGSYIKAMQWLSEDEEGENNFILFRNFLRLSWNAKPKESSDYIDKISKLGREKIKSILSEGLIVISDTFKKNIGILNDDKYENDEVVFFKNFSPYIHKDNVWQIYEIINEAIIQVGRNANTILMLQDVVYQINRQILKKS